MIRTGVAVALGALLAAAPAAGQGPTLVLDLLTGPPRAAVSVRGLLGRRAFLDALESGFPLYMEYRVRLRRPQPLRDRTIREDVWELVVVHDPVQDRYTVRTATSTEVIPDRTALGARLAQVAIVPFDSPSGSGSGEFFFDAVVTARMLSDDDVDEAFAWLRGEGVGGDSAHVEDPGLLARLARRVLIRVTALPNVRLEARTERFAAP
jgi:hypothetical protein